MKESCGKLIKYDQRVFEIKGLSPKILGAEFTVGEFSTHLEKVREAGDLALALDDYQYLMCKFCRGLGKDDPQWRKYIDLRASTIKILTDLRVDLAVLNTPTGSHRLVSTIEKMKSLNGIDKEVIPNATALQEKDQIAKDQIPEVKSQAVSDTKSISEIDEQHLDTLVKKLMEFGISISNVASSQETLIVTIRGIISDSREKYLKEEVKGTDLDDIYDLVFPNIRNLYLQTQYKQTIGGRYSAALNGHMSALAAQILQYRQSKYRQQPAKIQEYGTDAKYNFNEIMQLLDSIDISLPLVNL